LAAGDGFGRKHIAKAGNEFGPATCRLRAASGEEPLHGNGLEFDPPQADISQEVVVEIGERQHLAVRGDGTFPAEKGGEKRKHRRFLYRYF
jgi:hypothetical protein